MASFENFLAELKSAIGKMLTTEWDDYRKPATKDVETFLKKAKADLERWSTLLAEGRLTKKDFEWLVKSKADLAELEALKQRGVAVIRLSKLRKSLIATVVKTAFAVFL